MGDAELQFHCGCDSERDQKEAVIRTSLYDSISEKLLIEMHKPLWKAVITATYVDGKLLNPGYLTGSQVSVQHLENQMVLGVTCYS